MQDIFAMFGAIVLDSSLLFSKTDLAFFEQLRVFTENNGALFRYPAFAVESSELYKAVGKDLAKVYRYNVASLSSLTITAFKAKELQGECDCEALICMLIAQDIEVAVVSSNKLLNERLIMNDVQVSIIDPIRYSDIIRPQDFSSYKKTSDVLSLATPSAIPYARTSEGDRLVCGDGSSVVLTSVFNNEGKEAIIYNCDRDSVVAKIFKEGNLTDTKLENIRNFNGFNNNLQWLICPTDILYTETTGTLKTTLSNCPVGYLMPRIENVTDIGVEELFIGDIDCLTNEKYKDIQPVYVANVCIAILRQVLYLHMNGILFGDYNGGNFALLNDGSTDHVVFFDTDGYGYKNNPVVCAAAEFENPRTYNLQDKRDLLRSEYDNLFIAVFRWMTLGMLPFYKDESGNWNYRIWQNETEQRKARWDLIPKSLQKLFNRVFGNGDLITPTELLYTLKNAYRIISVQPIYRDHFIKILNVDQPIKKQSSVYATMPKQKYTPPPLSQPKPVWFFALVGIAVAVAIGATIWWFSFKKSDLSQDMIVITTATSVRPTEIASTSAEPELLRFERSNGYYYSYTGKLDGYIEYYWNNNDIYKGDFVDGVRTGSGVYIFASGDVYTGEFVDGMLTGIGKLVYSDGSVYQGGFSLGEYSGEGTLFNSQGDKVYSGGWKSGLYNGSGLYYFSKYAAYKDTWVDGTCKNGEPINLVHTESGKPIAKGYWRANIFYGSYYENDQWHDSP